MQSSVKYGVFTACAVVAIGVAGVFFLQQSGSSEQGDTQPIVVPFQTATSTSSRYVAYSLDGALFVRDLETGVAEEVSRDIPKSSPAYPSLSDDGRLVAFVGEAPPKPNGGNFDFDVFLYDRLQKKTELISVSTTGEGGNDYSDQPSLSADGRYVVFMSYASNLVAGDKNKRAEVFIRDRELGTTESVAVAGEKNRTFDESFLPKVSTDGRYVAFLSKAPDLVPDDANDTYDMFVRDRQKDETKRLTTDPNWIQNTDALLAAFEAEYATSSATAGAQEGLLQLLQALLNDLQ